MSADPSLALSVVARSTLTGEHLAAWTTRATRPSL